MCSLQRERYVPKETLGLDIEAGAPPPPRRRRSSSSSSLSIVDDDGGLPCMRYAMRFVSAVKNGMHASCRRPQSVLWWSVRHQYSASHKKTTNHGVPCSTAPPGGGFGGPVPPSAAHHRPRSPSDEAGNADSRPQFHEEPRRAGVKGACRISRVGLRPRQADGDAGRAPADDVGGLDR